MSCVCMNVLQATWTFTCTWHVHCSTDYRYYTCYNYNHHFPHFAIKSAVFPRLIWSIEACLFKYCGRSSFKICLAFSNVTISVLAMLFFFRCFGAGAPYTSCNSGTSFILHQPPDNSSAHTNVLTPMYPSTNCALMACEQRTENREQREQRTARTENKQQRKVEKY